MSCRYSIFLWIVLILVCSQAALAANNIKDLGTVGTTYPVVEADVVAELKKKALEQAATERPEPLLERIKAYQPANLQTLPHAEQDRTFLVNMGYSLEYDFVDGAGKIIYPRGFAFNPLDYLSFSGGLVVIDGTDSKQVNWFQKSPYAANHRARLLLSAGSAFELAQDLQRAVFYLTSDIATRLQLTAVPSVVVQQDRDLQVYEIAVADEHSDKAHP